MGASILLSKDYVNEVIGDYVEIVDNIDEIIKQTGYKGKFIAKKMGLPESTFYQKKRNRSFTHAEMQQIAALMDDDDDGEDDDAVELAYFAKALKERENETPIPLDEFISQFNAKRGEK
jgi:predicted transcriptional regulator